MMFIAGIAIAPTMTNVNTIVQKVVPSARLTEGLTWMSTAMTLGTSMGSAVAGPVIDNYSYHGGYLVILGFGIAMFLAAAIGYPVLKKAIQKRSPIVEVEEEAT